MNQHLRAACLTDARYALRQLREFRDIGRAIDALERIECRLEHADEYDQGGPGGEGHQARELTCRRNRIG
jgi:hypothetical protein